ncbi:hypothetical protein Skr01_27800 [Sphaerisporangium krabiense]|uniref:Secreted protein n=1 Tax=Sphaerisporangium krabiense TaxID=763782 RepID=A0A7W9DT29_9ACTN|nr:hypothetical protein [Sphaerisporangium krabiense]GII62695.1 hypothetical protein Skr01_27800 [Sphaerisporangium krabiense]
MKKWTSRLAVGASVALIATTLTAALPADDAYAVSPCCSTVHNGSAAGLTVLRDWTCNHGTTGTSSTGCAGGDTKYLSPGATTPSGEDWDVIRVDAYWCYKIQFTNWWGKVWTETYNRIGKDSPVYVKVEGRSLGDVRAQSSSSCP